MKKKKIKKNKKFQYSKVFLGLIFGFLVILAFFFILQSNFNFKLIKEVQTFEIVDTCGISPLGNEILHEVSSDSDCKIRCDNLCGVRDLKYVGHDFNYSVSSCHTCECSCK
ncbi:MAG TPA: hypothetical protein VJ895_00140 [Candidatus Nanoarchaeia archaeon]|nr:hypothetical protein [Candidatus Nanoarchaeia archaeon]